MDKDRFNALLADIDQITGEDIKSLNQLRKQYPHFQNQYVMIARALKKRNHPKTDAFIKKAAIYSADRALLKAIITDEHIFAAPAPEAFTPAEKEKPAVTPEKETVTKTEAPKAAPAKKEKPKAAAPKAAPAKEEVPKAETSPQPQAPQKEKAKAQAKTEEKQAAPAAKTTASPEVKAAPEVKSAPEPKPAPPPPPEKKSTPAPVPVKQPDPAPQAVVKPRTEAKVPEAAQVQSSTDQQMIDELEKDLKEIREKKRLIAKMLEQSDAKQSAPGAAVAEKKSAKPRKKSQSELIEKFIQNEPQMEKQKLIQDESGTEQVDLASKNIKESDDFHTETLARLMVKQKKYKKAIKIYEKLSLKFPEKRTYFASQIEKVNKKSNV